MTLEDRKYYMFHVMVSKVVIGTSTCPTGDSPHD